MQTLRPLSKKEKESAAGLWGEMLQVPELFAMVCTSAPAPSLLLSDGNAFNSEQARCCGGGVLFCFQFLKCLHSRCKSKRKFGARDEHNTPPESRVGIPGWSQWGN